MQYDQLVSAQTPIETELDPEHSEKLTSFKASLLLLAEAALSIAQEKEWLYHHNNKQFNERLLPLQESLLMIKEDIRGDIAVSESSLLHCLDYEGEFADFLEEIESRDFPAQFACPNQSKWTRTARLKSAPKTTKSSWSSCITICQKLARKLRSLEADRSSRDTKPTSWKSTRYGSVHTTDLYDFVAIVNRKWVCDVEDVFCNENCAPCLAK